MVLVGPAEPLGLVLEGPAEPVDAILRGLAEPLELLSNSEHFVDLYGTRASADAALDFTEEAQVLANSLPGPPEVCTEDRTVLSGQSKKKN